MPPTDPPQANNQAAKPPAADPFGDQARLRQGLTVAALSLLILMLCYLILQELTSILRPLLIAVFLYLFIPTHH